jgi:hypothetical protein
MRQIRLIFEAIEKFRLNLQKVVVLTEAASGNYMWTPIIAALAGAKVFAFSKDSKYASFETVKQSTLQICQQLGISKNVTVLDKLDKEVLGEADIITNLGFLRPLDSAKLQHCKKTCVIPLMYETWEFRTSDIDLNYCVNRQIPVLGTNEEDPRLQTIAYLGTVVKKVLLLHNIEVFKSKVIVLGRGKFAQAIKQGLEREAEIIDVWSDAVNVDPALLSKLDALIVADHETDVIYIGDHGLLSAEMIKELNPDILIVHVSGGICEDSLRKVELQLFPQEIMPRGYMSLRTDFAGPKPVIDLHTAGLKVGEIMYQNYLLTGNYDKCMELSKYNKLTQEF